MYTHNTKYFIVYVCMIFCTPEVCEATTAKSCTRYAHVVPLALWERDNSMVSLVPYWAKSKDMIQLRVK